MGMIATGLFRAANWLGRTTLALLIMTQLNACSVLEALHLNRGYDVKRELSFTPAGWPEPLTGDLYLPRAPGRHAVVLVVHGGSWQHGDKSDMAFICRELARNGIAAFTVNYRLAPSHHYPAPVLDLQQAVTWLRGHATIYQLDADEIGAWGYSAGAHLVAMLGTDNNPALHLRAIVAGGTPADLRRWPNSPIVKIFLGQNASENMALATEASPVSHVRADDPAFFFYHGANDTLVEPEQPQLFAEALKAKGVEATVYYLPGFGHILTAIFPGAAMDQGIHFLQRHMTPAKSATVVRN